MGIQGMYLLCISTGLIQEVSAKVRNKRDLARRIPPAVADELMAVVSVPAEIMEITTGAFRLHVRDPKDDYLIDHAVAAGVDYLVTGDQDLLDLEHGFGFRIVTPAEFVRLLDGSARG